MGSVVPLPKSGDVFVDERDDGRTMRVSRHDEHDVIVVSFWAGKQCRASFRLPLDEVDRLVDALSPPAAPAGSRFARWWSRIAS